MAKQHQYWPGTDVVRLVPFGHGEQPPHIVPRWPQRQRCLREDPRSPNGRRQSFTAPAPCFRKTKESPQCIGKGLNRLPRITTWIEQLLKRHVDPMRSDLVQRTTFDVQSIEKLRDERQQRWRMVAGRSSFFMLHVISERFDLLRPGSERGGASLQTTQEPKPSDGKSERGGDGWLFCVSPRRESWLFEAGWPIQASSQSRARS